MLSASGLKKTYRRSGGVVNALDDVALEVAEGQFVIVRGASGSGKTTLLLTVGGLLAPDEGRVAVVGQDPYELTAGAQAAFRARTIGFVFQQFHLVPYLTVYDNVLCPALGAGANGDRSARALELIERFQMTARRDHLPSELSTGEKQRCALARALLNEPRVLLADEPTGNLDEANEQIVLETFKSFASAGGAVLMVTHDRPWEDHADGVIHLEAGKVVSG